MSSQQRLNWTQILVAAFVTLVVTVTSSIALSYFQTREPHLFYSTTETIPFSGPEEFLGIYSISISNEGRARAKDVVCFVSIHPARIENWAVRVDPALQYTSSLTNYSLTLTLPILNPKEIIQISLLATHPYSLPEFPEISIRAEDVKAVEKTLERTENRLVWLYEIIISLIGVFSGLLIFYRMLPRVKISIDVPETIPEPVTISEPTYPLGRWEFLWFTYTGDNLNPWGSFLKRTYKKEIHFDEDWREEEVNDTGEFDNVGFRASRTLNIKRGRWRFILGGDDGIRLFVKRLDNTELFSFTTGWRNQAYTVHTKTQDLPSGEYKFLIEWYENLGAARASFSYEKIEDA